MRRSVRIASALACVSLAALAAAPSMAQAGAVSVASAAPGTPPDAAFSLHPVQARETLHILVGQSVLIRGTATLQRVYVGNPAVLQSFTSSPQEVVLTAKAPGVSSLVLWDTVGESRLYTVSADIDPTGLSQTLQQMYPGIPLQVQGEEDRLAVSGDVPTQEISDNITKLASLYTKDVANSLRVVAVHGKQVRLKLQILEVDRTKLDQYGINFTYGGKTAVTTSTAQFSNPLNFSIFDAKAQVGLTVQDLEQMQLVQILAEPTLTTLSGETARFLSGGEFPFPVVQGGTANSTAITIQFRPYGVKMDFTPIVNADGTIRLKVAPEVSTLDYTNAVSISGFTIPAISTRRAETDVEIRDGQSFVLSGLLDRRTTDLLARTPGIAKVPILGQLFRSKNNTHSIVELVVMVTASVVDPLVDPDTTTPKPVFAVPNMTPEGFDQQIDKQFQKQLDNMPEPKTR